MTFVSGYKTYYKQIVDGDLLVFSTFFPKAPWRVELAMARNPIIYGLAAEIFVAESSDKGGTWSGVQDGLRKGRKIFVRMPGPGEKCSNNLLISKGAIAVDKEGNLLSTEYASGVETAKLSIAEDPGLNLGESIQKLISERARTSKELIIALKLTWTTKKMNNYLNFLEGVESIKVKRNTYYRIKAKLEEKQGEFHFNQ